MGYRTPPCSSVTLQPQHSRLGRPESHQGHLGFRTLSSSSTSGESSRRLPWQAWNESREKER